MTRRILSLILLSLFFYAPVILAQPISSLELINKAKAYDGRVVAYEGEVIGDVMSRGNFSWINLYDGQNAVGCWVGSSLAKDIVYTGSYRTKGDLLEVIGIFYRSCPEHGGDLDIHVQVLRKIKSGRAVSGKISSEKKEFALTLFLILGAVWILKRLKIK